MNRACRKLFDSFKQSNTYVIRVSKEGRGDKEKYLKT